MCGGDDYSGYSINYNYNTYGSSSSTYNTTNANFNNSNNNNNNITSRVSVLQSVCTYCLQIASDECEDFSVKQTVFDFLCIPVLSRCHPYDLIIFFTNSWNNLNISIVKFNVQTSFIKTLFDIMQKNFKLENQIGTLENLLFLQSCCYKLIEVLYDRCTLHQIKNEISLEFAGPGSKGNELTSAVSKLAYKLIRTSFSENSNLSISSSITQRLYSSAFNCLAIVVAKTQIEEKFYDMFLFKQKPGEIVWSRIVDCSSHYRFFPETEKFETIFIGSGNVLQAKRRNVRKRLVSNYSNGNGSHLSQYLSGSLLEGSSVVNHSQSQSYGESLTDSRRKTGIDNDNNDNNNNNNNNNYNNNNRNKRNRRGMSSQIQSQHEVDYENLGLGFSSVDTTQHLRFHNSIFSVVKEAKNEEGKRVRKTQKTQKADDPRELSYYIEEKNIKIVDKTEKNDENDDNDDEDYDYKNKNEDDSRNLVLGLDDVMIALEVNDINKQPCMSSLLRIIKRMDYLFGKNNNNNEITEGDIPIFTTGVKWNKMILPNWITEIKNRLSDYDDNENDTSDNNNNENAEKRNRNIRLFMIRLLLNQPVAAIVSPYILSLLPSILECCNRDLCSVTIGSGYHYLLRDVVFTLCDSWKENILINFIQKDIEYKKNIFRQVSQLLSYLIKYTYSEDSIVLVENIRSIGALVQLFTDSTDNSFHLFFSLAPVLSLLSVVAGPTGGAFASSKSKGTEGVKKRLAGLTILQVSHITSYHILLYHILLYHILSYHILLYHILLYHILLYYILLFHILLYHILLYHILLYHILLYHILLYHILLYHILLYHILLSHILLYHIILYCIIFCFVICYVIFYYIKFILYYILLYYGMFFYIKFHCVT